jgi:hypothetical protein
MNTELARAWKDAVVPWYLTGGTDEIPLNLSVDLPWTQLEPRTSQKLVRIKIYGRVRGTR